MADAGEFAGVIAVLERIEKSLGALAQSTSSILELVKRRESIRKLSEPQTVALKKVPELLASWGYVDDKDDSAAERALATLMKRLLKDEKLVELMHLIQELRLLRPLDRAFREDFRVAPILGETFWNQYPTEIKRMEDRAKELLQAVQPQMRLLEFLANRSGAEELELPEVEPRYPPSEILPTQSSSEEPVWTPSGKDPETPGQKRNQERDQGVRN
jgi:hypothetical protein